MRTRSFLLTATSVMISLFVPHICIASEPDSHLLSSSMLELEIEFNGGHYTGLRVPGIDMNPLSWALTSEQMPPNNKDGAPFKGHFLCLGRWGAPSDSEIAAGIPHNGEQSNTVWTVDKATRQRVVMSNMAPLDGLGVMRTVNMLKDSPAFVVKETFTNTFSLGRVSNVVQHVTIGPPFLNKSTLINSNSGKGFNQRFSYPDPHAHEYKWPAAVIDPSSKEAVDIRRTDADINYVSTHLIQEESDYGWITAYDPQSGLLLGYIWRTKEYPWINIWNHYKNGQPAAKGLEFGTTGIGRPYKDLLETDTRFHDINSWEYIDAGEQITKTYVGFLIDHGRNKPNPALSVTDSVINLDGREFIKNPL
ncbi:MAG: hypothetical protein AB3N63_17765 [Puniceicoccaceae bacterium]